MAFAIEQKTTVKTDMQHYT